MKETRQAHDTWLGRFGALASAWAWVPLAIGLFAFTPVRSVFVLGSGEPGSSFTQYEGFPLLWLSDAPHVGMYREAYTAPFVANLVFFALVAWAIARLWRARRFFRHRALDWLLGLPTYLLGFFSTFILVVTALSDWTWVWWIDKSDWLRVDGFILPIP